MHKPESYLERANTLLKLIHDEQITSSSNKAKGPQIDLGTVRDIASKYSKISNKNFSALTAMVALTYLKVGLCQELASRFVLDYCFRYKKSDVSSVFLSKPGTDEKESHAIVFMGPIILPDSFEVGEGNSHIFKDPVEINQRLTDFIMAQKDITAFHSSAPKSKSEKNIDEKKEKEQQEFHDYMELMNSGVCDDKDIKRFGITTVDQG